MTHRSQLPATITKLWEAGADFESVLPRDQAYDAVHAAISELDRGESASPKWSTATSSCTSG